MKHLLLILLPLSTLLFLGCASKNITIMDDIKEQKNLSNIKLKDYFSNTPDITTYIDHKDKIKFICIDSLFEKEENSCSYTPSEDEEVISISLDGYSALYDHTMTRCGAGSHNGLFSLRDYAPGYYNYSNNKSCSSKYVTFDSETITDLISDILPTLGTSLLTTLTLHKKSFDKKIFIKSVKNSNIDSYKDELLHLIAKYKITGGLDFIYIERGDVEGSLEDKYEELLKAKESKSGIVFLDDDTNELLSLVIFDKYKEQPILAATALHIKNLRNDVASSDTYVLKLSDVTNHIPSVIPEIIPPASKKLSKQEFETIEAFNSRVKDAKDLDAKILKELEEEYESKVNNRTTIINTLNDNYAQYLLDEKEQRLSLLQELEKNIPLLAKVIFLEQQSSYTAKEFNYNAQSNELFFTLSDYKQNFKTKALAKIPADIARDIKTKNSFLIYPTLEYSNNTLVIKNFNLLETNSNEEFIISYTNKQHINKDISVTIKTQVYEMNLLEPKEFKDDYIANNKKIYTQTLSGSDITPREDSSLPRWWSDTSKRTNVACASADTLPEANKQARAELAAKIHTSITSSFTSKTTVGTFIDNNEIKENLLQTTDVELHVDDYEVLQQDKFDGRWYVALRYLK